MNLYAEKIKQILPQYHACDFQKFLQAMYEIRETRSDPYGEIERCSISLSKVLEPYLQNLDFAEQDAISCAINALCSAYDYTAFTEGFQLGAGSILQLLESA